MSGIPRPSLNPLNALADPKGPVLRTLDKLANAMFMLAESNNRLADAYERKK